MDPESPVQIATAIKSGDPDEVNRVIDAVSDVSPEERAEVFDAYFDVCRECYSAEDGYVRQSAIRLAEALHPGLEYRAVGGIDRPEPLEGTWTLRDTAAHRQQLRSLFLDALVDTDGRVRKSAIKGVKTIAVAADIIDNEDELEELLAELEALESESDGEIAAHIEEAIDQVTFYLDRSSMLLSEQLQFALQEAIAWDRDGKS